MKPEQNFEIRLCQNFTSNKLTIRAASRGLGKLKERNEDVFSRKECRHRIRPGAHNRAGVPATGRDGTPLKAFVQRGMAQNVIQLEREPDLVATLGKLALTPMVLPEQEAKPRVQVGG